MHNFRLTCKYFLPICLVSVFAACSNDEDIQPVKEQAATQVITTELTPEQLEQQQQLENQRRQEEIESHGHSHD